MCTTSVCVYVMSICRHTVQHVKDGQTTLQHPPFTFHKTWQQEHCAHEVPIKNRTNLQIPPMQNKNKKSVWLSAQLQLASSSVLHIQFVFATVVFPFQSSLLRIILSFKLYEQWLSPSFEMSPKRFTMAAVVLFSASQKTHCTLIICDSEWVTVAVHSTVLNITEVLTVLSEYPLKSLQSCLVVTWLVPRGTGAVSMQVLCTPYNHGWYYHYHSYGDTSFCCDSLTTSVRHEHGFYKDTECSTSLVIIIPYLHPTYLCTSKKNKTDFTNTTYFLRSLRKKKKPSEIFQCWLTVIFKHQRVISEQAVQHYDAVGIVWGWPRNVHGCRWQGPVDRSWLLGWFWNTRQDKEMMDWKRGR